MIRHTLIALTLPLALMSTAAFADDGAKAGTGSEYEHQAAAGAWEVTPGFTFGSFKSSVSTTCAACSSFTSQTDSSTAMFVKGEYGINEMFSAGLMLSYGMDSYSYSPSQTNIITKATGMMDPVIYFMGHNDVGPGSIHYGLNWDISVAKQQLNTTTTNEASGGMTFTPFVGYEMNVGPGILGAKLMYDVVQTSRSVTDNQQNPSQSATVTGGNNLSLMAFWEMNFSPVIWGVDLGIINHASETEKENAQSQSLSDSMTAFNIATYANWEVTPDIHILPTLGYGATPQAIAGAAAGTSSVSGIYGTVAARFAF